MARAHLARHHRLRRREYVGVSPLGNDSGRAKSSLVGRLINECARHALSEEGLATVE